MNKICVHLRASAVKFIMNSKNLSDIVKVTAAILAKNNKIIIAKRGYGTKGSRIQGFEESRV